MIHTIVSERWIKRGALGIGALIIIGFCWWGYSVHKLKKNQEAQVMFSALYADFEKIEILETIDPKLWLSVAQKFEKAYSEHAGTKLGPLFLAFAGDASEHAGDYKKSVAYLEQAIREFGSSHPFYYLYSIKLQVLRMLANFDEKDLSEAEKSLISLAQDVYNPYQALAWYRLWQNAWVKGDHNNAQIFFAELSNFANEPGHWLELAKKKIEFLA